MKQQYRHSFLTPEENIALEKHVSDIVLPMLVKYMLTLYAAELLLIWIYT